MISINPALNSERENYKLLTGSIIPRPIAFVTTKSSQGVLNGAPFSFFNVVSSNPPMISLSVQRKAGEMKDTARNIMEAGEFVVHIVDEQNVEKVNKTSASLPSWESEIELAGLTEVTSEKISVSGIKEAKVRMECVLEKSLVLGDTEAPACDFIIARVVQIHVAEEVYEEGRINPKVLAAVCRLAGNNYASLGEIFVLERPL